MAEINELIFKLESTDPNIWREAIDKLSNIGGEQSERILMQVVNSSSDLGKKYYAKKVLSTIKSNSTKASGSVAEENSSDNKDGDKILSYLNSENYETVIKAIMHVAKHKMNKYYPELIKMTEKDLHPYIRATIVKGIAYLGRKEALPYITPYLKDEDNRVRANTLEAMEICGAENIFDHVIGMLNDPDNRVKANALKILQKFDRNRVINIVKNMISSSEEYYILSALFVIETLKLWELIDTVKSLKDDERVDIRTKVNTICKKAGIKDSENNERKQKARVNGRVKKVIIGRGIVIQDNKKTLFGVVDSEHDYSPDEYLDISGTVTNNDGFYFIFPESVKRILAN